MLFRSDVILQEFNNQMGLQGYSIEYYADFTPRSFNQPNWNSFWHIDAKKNMAPGEPADAFISIFKIKKNKKTWNLYYFGTEAFQTFEILLQNTIKMDVVVTQDHGLGCFWDTFCKYSRLEKTARHLNLMPDYLLVGLNDEPWDYYLQTKKPFGAFGSWQHQRKLFKRSSYYEDNM